MSAPNKSADSRDDDDDDAWNIQLPPIDLPSTSQSLTETQKKLLKYRRVKEQQKMLNKIIVTGAMQDYTTAIEEFAKKGSPPPAPELPATMNSEQRKIRHLTEGKGREKLVEQLLAEVTTDYEMSMKRYMVRSVLVKPSVKGLEYEKEEPLPVPPM
ncbi:UNVERIFIED_CONTAM: hypothetical protein K2H54_049984 [Gekko kuhli]